MVLIMEQKLEDMGFGVITKFNLVDTQPSTKEENGPQNTIIFIPLFYRVQHEV